MLEIKPYSLEKAKELITIINSMPIETTSIDSLKEKIGHLLKGYIIATPPLNKGQKLYRAVPWDEKPTHKKHIIYRLPEDVKENGRAHRENESRFYSSVSFNAAIFESRASLLGGCIAVSCWQVTEKLPITHLGYETSIFTQYQSARKELPPWRKPNPMTESLVNTLIHDFLAKSFAREVPDDSKHLYKLSIAISELMINNPMEGTHDSKENRTVGILYPAFAMHTNADNAVLLTDVMDKYLQFKEVEYIQVDGTAITRLDFANSLAPDGKIEWKGRKKQWTVPVENLPTLKLKIEDGRQVVRNKKGEIIDPN